MVLTGYQGDLKKTSFWKVEQAFRRNLNLEADIGILYQNRHPLPWGNIFLFAYTSVDM